MADYRALAQHGMRTVRDGLRWHLIETSPGQYDWSSFLPMLRAARDTDTQVIWDLAHWGWPDDLDIWSPAFVDRFGKFARAVAQVVRDETDAVPFYVPVNELSFWSWAGGSLGLISPLAQKRGDELKTVLVQAAMAAIEAVRSIDPRARIVSAEPTIHVIEGLCIYPITDYPGWDDERHCPTGLLGYVGSDGHRPVDQPFARELWLQQGGVETASE
jgi:beta-glucosidase/6-phospho-beta-glucosidase/beta-galactosidase